MTGRNIGEKNQTEESEKNCDEVFFPLENTVSTVLSLGEKKPDDVFALVLDVTKLRKDKITYDDIKTFIYLKYGFYIRDNFISQIRNKYQIDKIPEMPVPNSYIRVCPPEKEDAIVDAFKHFNLLE